MFAVGVGDDYKLEEVQVIATDPDENYVIQALNFDIIELKRRGLVKVQKIKFEKSLMNMPNRNLCIMIFFF